MLDRTLQRIRRLNAALLAVANLPRPPPRPASIDGDWEYLKSRMRWFIRRHAARSGVPGLSIALVDDRKLLWAEGFGWADRARRRPATAETIYQVGSITKVINAIAFLQLLDEGRVDLDLPLKEYLPEFRMRTRWPQASPITLRALLCHHAGLPTYYLKGFFSNEPLSKLLEALRDEHLAYEPHTVFNYSNLGPDLLGLVLERLRNQPYGQAVSRSLLEPLGMTHSGFSPDGLVSGQLARGYVNDAPSKPTPIRDIPAGGLYSNVLDLAQFMRMVLAGGECDGVRIVSRNVLEESMTPQYPGLPLDFGQHFGLGWMLSGLPIDHAGMQAWHNGGTKTFLSQMALLPEKKLGVVVLANSDRGNALVHEVAEEALRLALEVRDNLRPSRRNIAPEVPVARDRLAGHVGDYSLMGSLARISLGRKHLRLHILNHKLDLVPVAENRFRVAYNFLGIRSVPIPFPPVEFTRVGDRRFALLRDRVVVPAERLPQYTIPDSWHGRAGEYRLLNPDDEYLVDLEHCRMEIADGRLLLHIRISGIENREVRVVVVPLSEHEGYVFGLGRNVGDVSYNYRDGERILTRFSGYLFERLR